MRFITEAVLDGDDIRCEFKATDSSLIVDFYDDELPLDGIEIPWSRVARLAKSELNGELEGVR